MHRAKVIENSEGLFLFLLKQWYGCLLRMRVNSVRYKTTPDLTKMPEEYAGKKFGLKNNNEGYVMLFLLIATLLPFFILSFYNHPSADDYAETIGARQNGSLGFQKLWYLTWSGRYFDNLILSINPLVYGAAWAYKFNAILLLILFTGAAYWLSGRLFKNADRLSRSGVTSFFVFAFIFLLPDVGQGIFWQSGAYTCFTAEILTLFLMGCILSYYQSDNAKSYFAISSLTIIAIVGLYELNMIFTDLFIMAVLVISVIKKGKLKFPAILMIVGILASLFEITAPGNAKRGEFWPNAHHFLFSIKESFLYGNTLLMHWLPFMLLVSLLLVGFLSKRASWNTTLDSIFSVPPLLCLIACLSIPFIGLIGCYWAQGVRPVGRSVNVIYFYFVIGMMYFSFISLKYIVKKHPGFSLPAYIKIPLVLIFLFIFRINNISLAYRDIALGSASAYNKERAAREEFLLSFKGDSCIVTPIKKVPDSFYFEDITPDRNYWINTSYCAYYHKRFIGLKDK
jgi:hypothetical protein